MQAREFIQKMRGYQRRLQKEKFAKLRKRAESISTINVEMINELNRRSQGGKDVRSGLVILGYMAGTGQNRFEVLESDVFRAAIAVELFHVGWLIADDIMDKSDLRRGLQTTHRFYEKRARKYEKQEEKSFGISMAMNLSLCAVFFAEEILAKAGPKAERIVKAQKLLNGYLTDVAFGQGMDIALSGRLTSTEKDVIKIHKYKTAFYSVVGPLQTGGVLGGGSKEQLNAMEEYGINIGIAFQLRDDELGIFGEENTIGKSADSDIKEGKNTILLVKALERAEGRDRKTLQEHYGDPDISTEQAEQIRRIIRKTGALKYSQKLCRIYLQKGLSAVEQITKDDNIRDTLVNIAHYIVNRGK